MIDNFLRRPWIVAQLHESVLGSDLDDLADELQRVGFTIGTIQNHLHVVGHLAYWMAEQHLAVHSLDEAMIRRFRKQHWPVCCCRVPHGTAPDLGGVAPHLLKLLRSRGRIPEPPQVMPTPVETLLDAFSSYLQANRGLTPSTCERAQREINRYLQPLFCKGPVDFESLTVASLRSFVLSRTKAYSTVTGRHAASALRSFLRFLFVQGLTDGALLLGVPTVRNSRRSALPQPLTSAQLDQLLTSIDRTRPAGLRDHAILLSLARVGLRAKEVAELRLDDIDWRSGTLTIAFSKGRRASILPLPQDVGNAITTYLRRGRPLTEDRHVFVRHFFPVGEALRSVGVSHAVQRAFRRSGLEVPSRGSHTLRHTAATEMVRAGASLKVVADVLRHRSIDTTAVYTKIDLVRLRDVAVAWPEVQP